MFGSLATRQCQPEWMDEPDADPAVLRDSLRFIRRVNRLFGYTRATVHHLDRFSRRWRKGERIDVLDLATGSADIPLAILRWADAKAFDVHVVGVDLHETTARDAVRNAGGHPRLRIVRANVLDLPFADGSFDYTITNMFLHHLGDDEVTRVLAAMGRIARRGVIAADLIRNARALAWIKLFTLASNPMVRHDAAVSVLQAFTRDEICAIRDRAGIGFAGYHRHFGHRFVLAGEKPASTNV